jgi:hypothetical protein
LVNGPDLIGLIGQPHLITKLGFALRC